MVQRTEDWGQMSEFRIRGINNLERTLAYLASCGSSILFTARYARDAKMDIWDGWLGSEVRLQEL